MGHLHAQSQLLATLLRDGGTEHAATVLKHEVDFLRGDLFGGNDEVAFVLAVFVVDNNEELAFAEVFDRFFDCVQSVHFI